MNREKIAGILLAAGGSVRMGEPKQLLQVSGVTLIRRAAQAMLDTGLGPVLVVVGREAESMRRALAALDVTVVENGDWEKGMGTSIKAGINTLQRMDEVDAVLMSVCDQPLVGVEQLSALTDAWTKTGLSLAAATFSGSIGTPAIFDAGYFWQLRALDDHAGAKAILKGATPERLVKVPMDEAAMDLDTPADWHRFHQLFTARSRTA